MIKDGKVYLDELDMYWHIKDCMSREGYEIDIDVIQKVIDYEIDYLTENGLIEYEDD